MKLWITEYALTTGIIEAEGKVDGKFARVIIDGPWTSEASIMVPDWHQTEAEAIARADRMRIKKIASLRAQIAKLEAMTFSLKD